MQAEGLYSRAWLFVHRHDLHDLRPTLQEIEVWLCSLQRFHAMDERFQQIGNLLKVLSIASGPRENYGARTLLAHRRWPCDRITPSGFVEHQGEERRRRTQHGRQARGTGDMDGHLVVSNMYAFC